MSGEPLRIDLACGNNKLDGWWGVDVVDTDAADQVVDLEVFPWPWDDDSVDALHSSHYVEHTPMQRPDGRDGLVAFMDEAWRILKPDGEFKIAHPYCMSTRAFQDPYHRRFIPEATWYYFSREWRELQGLAHYPIKSDFDVVTIEGAGVPNDFQLRSDQYQSFARTHYWHTIADLVVTLRKRPA